MLDIPIESSPALRLAMPVTPLPVAEALDAPHFFIRAPYGDDEPRLYSLETAPIEIFNAWVNTIIAAEGIDDPLCLFIIKRHSQTWDDIARSWLLINLQVHSIDITKYAYTSREMAEQVVSA